jgi:hypothetical protein
MFGLDPFLSTLLVGGGLFYLGYWRGKNVSSDKEWIISNTIDKLCLDGYIHHFRNADGEIELLTINEYYLRNYNKNNSKEN